MKGKNENIMDEVQIRLLPDDLCEKAYGGRFSKNMMKCAGKIEGGIDTCQVSFIKNKKLFKKQLVSESYFKGFKITCIIIISC